MEGSERLSSFLYNNTNNSQSGVFNESYRRMVAREVMKTDSSDYVYDYDERLRSYQYRGYGNFTTDQLCAMRAYRYINVTCDFPINYAEVLFGYIAPFLLVVAAVANTLILAVLSRPHMRNPTNVLLMAIAVCDMLTILFPAPWHFYLYTLRNHYKPLGPAAVCTVWHHMTEVVPTMFRTASLWLTLALAVQRYIYVCHAPFTRTWCTIRGAVQCVVCIGVTAFLYQLQRFLDRIHVNHKTLWRGHIEVVCKRDLSPWVQTHRTYSYYTSVANLFFSVLFVYLVPCVSLVVFNALLIRAMRNAQQNRRKLFRENRKSEGNRLRDSNTTTWMLIVVITIVILPLLPLTAVGVNHFIYIDDIYHRLHNNSKDFPYRSIEFFITYSYPLNFVIYCFMSRQFRETFKGLSIRSAVPNN